MAADIVDGFVGCLLAAAIGDALGMPVEGFSSEEIRKRFGKVREMMPAPEGHFHFGLESGQFTDDTLETLILAESMIESYGFSADNFSEKLASWGGTWALDEKLGRGVGLTSRSSIEQMRSGASWKESGLSLPTCGSAMRAAPIGLFYHCDIGLVSRYADLQSIPTHCGVAARAGSIAVACGVALGLMGFPKASVLKMVSELSSRADKDFSEKLLLVNSLLEMEPTNALSLIGTSPAVFEVVPAAFYCFLKFSPEEAIIAAASGGGDTDSIASIVGALAGASEGTGWIPERWRSTLEDAERIEAIGKKLAELSLDMCSGKKAL